MAEWLKYASPPPLFLYMIKKLRNPELELNPLNLYLFAAIATSKQSLLVWCDCNDETIVIHNVLSRQFMGENIGGNTILFVETQLYSSYEGEANKY